VTLSRKGVKSRARRHKLRSIGTKASTHVDRLRAANADLKKKLAEALEQQAATSEVLGVISRSPGDLEPVFQAMLANATKLCGAEFGILNLDDGDVSRIAAVYNVPPALAAARREKDREFGIKLLVKCQTASAQAFAVRSSINPSCMQLSHRP
jgi:hypothetical protein